jgi:hypothetical protein
MKIKRFFSIILFTIIFAALSSCRPVIVEPTITPSPSSTAFPTDTPLPTSTPWGANVVPFLLEKGFVLDAESSAQPQKNYMLKDLTVSILENGNVRFAFSETKASTCAPMVDYLLTEFYGAEVDKWAADHLIDAKKAPVFGDTLLHTFTGNVNGYSIKIEYLSGRDIDTGTSFYFFTILPGQ